MVVPVPVSGVSSRVRVSMDMAVGWGEKVRSSRVQVDQFLKSHGSFG